MFPEGQYTLTATATDWWGNLGESEPVMFVVGDPPAGDGDGDPGDGDGDGDGDGAGDGDGDTGDGDGDTGESGGTSDDLGADNIGNGEGEGCSCNSRAPQSPGLAWALFLLPLVLRRHRFGGR
jgi:hypothetical protein